MPLILIRSKTEFPRHTCRVSIPNTPTFNPTLHRDPHKHLANKPFPGQDPRTSIRSINPLIKPCFTLFISFSNKIQDASVNIDLIQNALFLKLLQEFRCFIQDIKIKRLHFAQVFKGDWGHPVSLYSRSFNIFALNV